jgi:hypothetical protein
MGPQIELGGDISEMGWRDEIEGLVVVDGGGWVNDVEALEM